MSPCVEISKFGFVTFIVLFLKLSSVLAPKEWRHVITTAILLIIALKICGGIQEVQTVSIQYGTDDAHYRGINNEEKLCSRTF